MPNSHMDDLAKQLSTNPALMKAALSGMQEGIKNAAISQNLTIHSDAIAALGKVQLASGAGGGSPVADDYAIRGVSSVIAAVKIRPTDLLAHVNDAATHLQNINVKKLRGGTP